MPLTRQRANDNVNKETRAKASTEKPSPRKNSPRKNSPKKTTPTRASPQQRNTATRTSPRKNNQLKASPSNTTKAVQRQTSPRKHSPADNTAAKNSPRKAVKRENESGDLTTRNSPRKRRCVRKSDVDCDSTEVNQAGKDTVATRSQDCNSSEVSEPRDNVNASCGIDSDITEVVETCEAENVETSAGTNVETSEAKSVETSEGKNVETLEAKNVETSEGKNIETSEAKNVETSEAKNVETSEAKNVETSEAKNVETSEGTNVETSEAKNVETSEGTTVETFEAKNVETWEAKNVKTSEGKNVETSEGKNVETSEAKNVETSEAKKVETSEAKNVETSEGTNVETSEETNLGTSEAKTVDKIEHKNGENMGNGFFTDIDGDDNALRSQSTEGKLHDVSDDEVSDCEEVKPMSNSSPSSRQVKYFQAGSEAASNSLTPDFKGHAGSTQQSETARDSQQTQEYRHFDADFDSDSQEAEYLREERSEDPAKEKKELNAFDVLMRRGSKSKTEGSMGDHWRTTSQEDYADPRTKTGGSSPSGAGARDHQGEGSRTYKTVLQIGEPEATSRTSHGAGSSTGASHGVSRSDHGASRGDHGPSRGDHGPSTSHHGPSTSHHGPSRSDHGASTSHHGPSRSDHGPSTSHHGASSSSEHSRRASPPKGAGPTGGGRKESRAPTTSRSPWTTRDTEDYQKGYPGKKDDRKADKNYRFYSNKLRSYPDGDFIDVIHKTWRGNYPLLERHHGYIQWLFPIREQGMNYQAQELQLHEIKSIKADEKAFARVRRSYELMLDFYGIMLVDRTTGEVARAGNWEPRAKHLNRSHHNFLRITRILKCLGELGYEHYQFPLVEFFLHETIETRALSSATNSCLNYWIHTLRNEREREKLMDLAHELQSKHPPPDYDDYDYKPEGEKKKKGVVETIRGLFS